MQEIKITEEMKNDAVKLINAVDVFKGKYGLPIITVDVLTYLKKLTIYGDRDENDEFDAWDIHSDGTAEIRHISKD